MFVSPMSPPMPVMDVVFGSNTHNHVIVFHLLHNLATTNTTINYLMKVIISKVKIVKKNSIKTKTLIQVTIKFFKRKLGNNNDCKKN